MRLDSFMNTVFTNTMGVMSDTWNAVTGQSIGWRYPQRSNTYNSNRYQSNQHPRYVGTQTSSRGTVRHSAPPRAPQPLVSTRPYTVNYISYVFNSNYVTVAGVKSAQVGVHINNGNDSMNDGNFGNYGNNGNSGSQSRYSNHGSNGNRQFSANRMPVGNGHARRLQG